MDTPLTPEQRAETLIKQHPYEVEFPSYLVTEIASCIRDAEAAAVQRERERIIFIIDQCPEIETEVVDSLAARIRAGE